MEFAHLIIDPEICQGKATVRGRRITVEFVLKLLGNGYDAKDIVRQYPELTRADVSQCARCGAWLAGDRFVGV